MAIDYVAAVDPIKLQYVEVVNGPTVLAVAARVGATRLIDNIVIGGMIVAPQGSEASDQQRFLTRPASKAANRDGVLRTRLNL